MSDTNSDASKKLAKLLSITRRAVAVQSPEAFAKIYLAKHFVLPPSRMHKELFELTHPDNIKPGARMAIAAPRSHAKSTIMSLACVLYWICTGREQHIVMISSTRESAELMLSHVKAELSDNEALRQDFPEVCEPEKTTPKSERWARVEIITRNKVKVTAAGALAKLRGRRFKQYRPTLIICDDMESDGGAASEVQRETLFSWFHKVVLSLGTHETKIVVVGTVLHYDSLLARLIDPQKSPNWIGRKYQAIERWDDQPVLWDQWAAIYMHNDAFEGSSGPDPARSFFEQNRDLMLENTQVLWPEYEDYYTLRVMRLTAGQASFDSEKQNEPIDSASCIFPEESMRYWEDRFDSEEQLLAHLGDRAVLFGACDPSMGKAGKSRDDTAIVTVAFDRDTGHIYVLDAHIARLRPDRILEAIISFQQHRKYKKFAMETVQFQEFLGEELIRRSMEQRVNVPVVSVKPVKDKIGRIESLQPLVSSGVLWFSRRHRRCSISCGTFQRERTMMVRTHYRWPSSWHRRRTNRHRSVS